MAGSCLLSYPDGTSPTALDENPSLYEDGPAGRRLSSHATFGGERVWQDFGAPERDRRIRLRTDWMSQATLDAFAAKYGLVGQVWRWVDHVGHEYRVVFRAFGPERIRGHEAYRVEMAFDVIDVVV